MVEGWSHCLIWPGCGESADDIPGGTLVRSERTGGCYIVAKELVSSIPARTGRSRQGSVDHLAYRSAKANRCQSSGHS